MHLGMVESRSRLLFGRSEEMSMIKQAVEKARSGTSVSIFVSGATGVGKTSLVSAALADIEADCISGSGKIDQLLHGVESYAAIKSAFSQVCDKLLQSKDSALWHDRLRQLDSNGDVRELIKIIPKVADLLLDPSTSTDQGSRPGSGTPGHRPTRFQAQKKAASTSFKKTSSCLGRVRHALNVFTRAIALHSAGPLIIHIDDLMWADAVSLSLLTQLISDSELTNFIFIGTYRDDKIDTGHPWTLSMRGLEENKHVDTLRITVGNLYRPSANVLVAALLQLDPSETYSLSGIMYLRTSGNPLQHVLLLHYLQLGGLAKSVTTDANDTTIVDLEQIGEELRKHRGASAVDLMASKICDLPNELQLILKSAACLASRFTVDILTKIMKIMWSNGDPLPFGEIGSRMESRLQQLTDMGIIRRKEEGGVDEQFSYSFVHDKLQQAALELDLNMTGPSIEQDSNIYLIVGHFLLNLHDSDEDSEDWVLLVATDLLNRCYSPKADKLRRAALNLESAKLAIDRCAFDLASTLLVKGVSLLSADNLWDGESYKLAIDLFTTLAEVEYRLGDLVNCYKHVDTVLLKARSLDEKLRVHFITVEALGSEGRINDALMYGSKVLGKLGESLPVFPSKVDVLSALAKTRVMMLRFRKDESIFRLPKMTNPKKMAAMRMLSVMPTYAFFSKRPAYIVTIGLLMVRLSLRYGISDWSSLAFTIYGMATSCLGDYQRGYRYGQVGLAMLDDLKSRKGDAPAILIHHAFLHHLYHNPRESIEPLRYATQISYQNGDISFSSQAASMYGYICLFCGSDLSQTVEDIKNLVGRFESYENSINFTSIQIDAEVGKRILGETDNPTELTVSSLNIGDLMNDDAPERIRRKYRLMQMILAFIFREEAVAEEYSSQLWAEKENTDGTLILVPHRFLIKGLIAASMVRATGEMKHRWRLRTSLKALRSWKRKGAAFVDPFLILLETVQLSHRAPDNVYAILTGFDMAGTLLARDSFLSLAAVAHEEAASYLLRIGDPGYAKTYLGRAITLYADWGANAKVDLMKQEHEFLADWSPDDQEDVEEMSTLVRTGDEVVVVTDPDLEGGIFGDQSTG